MRFGSFGSILSKKSQTNLAACGSRGGGERCSMRPIDQSTGQLSKVQSVNQRMRLGMRVGFRQQRTHAPQQIASLARSPRRQARVPFRRNQDRRLLTDRRCNLAASLIARRLIGQHIFRGDMITWPPARSPVRSRPSRTVGRGASGTLGPRRAAKGRSNRRMAGSSFRCDRSDSRRRRAR